MPHGNEPTRRVQRSQSRAPSHYCGCCRLEVGVLIAFSKSAQRFALTGTALAFLTAATTVFTIPSSTGSTVPMSNARVDIKRDPLIGAAGDIACSPTDGHFNEASGVGDFCQADATSNLLLDARFSRVLTLGDTQYLEGSFTDFQHSYDPTWGRVKAITTPAIGNHEYRDNNGAGYFRYFGEAAGNPAKGYYSYNLGAWHLIALNSQCSELPRGTGDNGCATGSMQNKWLRADLAAHPTRCTLAYWHRPPVFSPGQGNDSAIASLWAVLARANVDVALTGHHHNYQRFAPLDATGRPTEGPGLRQFVVGTGGKSENELGAPRPGVVQVRQDNTYGILKMRLHETRYHWRFVATPGSSFTDSGTTSCH